MEATPLTLEERRRLHAYEHMACTMGSAIALVETEPNVHFQWLQPGGFGRHFGETGPRVSELFAAAQGEQQERLAAFWTQMEQEPQASCELALTLPDGEESWFRLLSTQNTYPNGTAYLLLNVMDIDQQLAGQAEQIEERRKETIQNMAAGIAHEFNNNLTPIRGFIELTLDCLETAHPAADGLRTALQQAEACAELVQQIMFSSSNSVLNLREVDPTSLLSNIIYDASHTLLKPEYHIEVIQDIATDLPRIQVDHKVFRDSIRHLLRNAVTAMPEGGTLKISAKRSKVDPESTPSSKDDHICILIEDNGAGIAPEDMRKVFDPFFTTRNRAEARGMGLPMVEGMVTQMGGWVQIDSGTDQGTAVTIYLPSLSEEKEDSSTVSTYSMASSTPPPGRMLIADDEDYVLKLITRLFAKQGWEITEASSFYEVLNVVDQHPDRFDVLVLDIGMPGPSAEETLKRIREANCHSHIVLVSGFPEDNRIRNLVDLCHGSFISKPFSLSSLLERVQDLMATTP